MVCSWLAPTLRLGCGLLMLAGLTACDEVLGADDFAVREPSKQSPDAGWLDWLSQECLACAELGCEEILASCRADSACAAALTCFGEDPSPGQRAACSATHPEGATGLVQVGRCLGLSCPEQCGGGGNWICLGRASPVARPTRLTFEYRVHFEELLSNQFLQGLRVRACPKLDWNYPDCSADVDAEGITDANGDVALDITFPVLGVRQPWDGYLDVSGANYYADMRYFNLPMSGDVSITISGISQQTFDLVSAAYQVAPMPERGLLTLAIFDCMGMPAPGVSVEISPSDEHTRRFYFKGKAELDEAATETRADGLALFANVLSGRLAVRATVVATGAKLPEVEVYVRPSRRTSLYLEPYEPAR